MPSRTYRCDSLAASCVTCRDGIVRWETLRQDFMLTCPECDNPVHVAVTPETAPVIGAMDPRLDSEPLYMSQLVKRGDPNPRANPANYVSGPHSWRRAVEAAKRDGVRVLTNNEADDMRSPREIKRQERRDQESAT